jgi:hypothetical protein
MVGREFRIMFGKYVWENIKKALKIQDLFGG